MGLIKIKIDGKEVVVNGLTDLKTRLAVIPAVPRIFDSATEAGIPTALADILAKEILSNNAKGVYEGANGAFTGAVDNLRLDEIDYLETFQRKVRRGIYPIELRASFGLDKYTDVLPYLGTPAAVKTVGGNIHTGDAAIVSGSYPLMVDFPESAIASQIAALIPLEVANSLKEGLAGTAEANMTVSVNTGKGFVEDGWAQGETFLRKLVASARRAALGLWGVKYVATKEFTSLYIKSTFLVGGADANGCTWRLGKLLTTRGKPAIGGITGTAVAYGTVDLDTTQVGDLYLIGNCVGC